MAVSTMRLASLAQVGALLQVPSGIQTLSFSHHSLVLDGLAKERGRLLFHFSVIRLALSVAVCSGDIDKTVHRRGLQR